MQQVKVIVADDHKLFRAGLISILSDFKKIKVIGEAADGQELLDMLPEKTPDVILLDLNMPNVSGIEALPKISESFPDIKVIIISMLSTETHIARALQDGASGYLNKNAEPDEIQRAIENVINNGFYFSDSIGSSVVKQLAKFRKPLPTDILDTKHIPSETELQVLKFLCAEMTTAEIATRMYVSSRTVDGLRINLLKKTGARNIAGLVLYAVHHGIVEA